MHNILCTKISTLQLKRFHSMLTPDMHHNRGHQHCARGYQVARTDSVSRQGAFSENSVNMIMLSSHR